MSKLYELTAKLEALQLRLDELNDERAAVMKEVASIQEMLDIVNEILADQKEKQEEAYATLITQRDNEGKITDADFLCFSDASGISTSGLIDRPTDETAPDEETQEGNIRAA